MKGKKMERAIRINISMLPELLKGLDKMAKDLNMTRSRTIEYMVRINQAMSSNTDLIGLIDSQIEAIMEAKEKKGEKVKKKIK